MRYDGFDDRPGNGPGVRVLLAAAALLAAATAVDAEVTFLNAWGEQGTADGWFDAPVGVAVSPAGLVYVTETGNDRVQRFDAEGRYETQWGGTGSGNGQFDAPRGIAVSPLGRVYVADAQNHRIQRFDANGVFQTKWGSLGTGDGQFDQPTGVAVSPAGVVYVADSQNHRIQRFSAGGGYQTKWGSPGSGDGQFDQPPGVTVCPLGRVYVADMANHRIQRFDADGVFQMKFGGQGTADGYFANPTGVAASPAGMVYVVDCFNHRIQRFESSGGDFQMKWGARGDGDGDFYFPADVAVSPAGMVYVADTFNYRVQRFFDSEAWVSGTNEFVDPAVGPVDVGVGTGRLLGAALTLDAGMGLIVAGTTTVHAGEALTVDGGTIDTGRLALATGASLTAVGNVTGKVSGANGSVIAASGPLALGRTNTYAAFHHEGSLMVGPHVVVLNTLGFAALGELTTLDGGRLIAVHGASLGGGDSLVGSGTVSARIAAAVGSSIVAEGDLVLGEDSLPAGFVGDGELHLNDHTVTIHDADLAVLGSVTTLGRAASGGTLTAPNGSLLGFGRALAGFGVVAGRFVNNGDVYGGTGGQTLEFTGPVTGVGDFHDSVTFSGGYSPGLSTAEVDLDDATFSATNTLTIELGGPGAGSDFDRLNASGAVAFDGALAISLIGNFQAQPGDEFAIVGYGSRTGEFASTLGWNLGPLALVRLYRADGLVLHAAGFGDANLDGAVNILDLGALAANYKQPGDKDWQDGDFNDDGAVNILDLGILAGNYKWSGGGGSGGLPAGGGGPVPEPATLWLLALAALRLRQPRRTMPRIAQTARRGAATPRAHRPRTPPAAAAV